MNFSIVIPVYNEEKNIESLIDEIFFNLNKTEYKYEIIIVDDFSKDSTLKIASSLKTKNPGIVNVIKNLINLGQSKSIYNGIISAKSDVIVTIDGDGQNNPSDIPMLLKRYFSEKEIFLVGGIRINRKDSFFKKISSKIANKIRAYILKDNCVDTGCSLKIFDKNFFLMLPFFDGIHRFLPALFSGYNKKTLFINVDHRVRKFGNSNYGTFKRMFKGIVDIIRVMKIIKNMKN